MGGGGVVICLFACLFCVFFFCVVNFKNVTHQYVYWGLYTRFQLIKEFLISWELFVSSVFRAKPLKVKTKDV